MIQLIVLRCLSCHHLAHPPSLLHCVHLFLVLICMGTTSSTPSRYGFAISAFALLTKIETHPSGLVFRGSGKCVHSSSAPGNGMWHRYMHARWVETPLYRLAVRSALPRDMMALMMRVESCALVRWGHLADQRKRAIMHAKRVVRVASEISLTPPLIHKNSALSCILTNLFSSAGQNRNSPRVWACWEQHCQQCYCPFPCLEQVKRC